VDHDASVEQDGPSSQRFKDGAALTFQGWRAILPALMRRLAVTLLALAALATLQACSNSCQDLGDRICACSGGGSASDTCKQQVKNQLSAAGVSGDDKNFCAKRLSSCALPGWLVHTPAQVDDARFCEWIGTTCGKASCGLSNEDPADLAVCAAPPAP
jgi:hypothetical protein